AIYVLPKSGVTDSVADNARKLLADFGLAVDALRTFKKYWITGLDDGEKRILTSKLLANDAVEQVIYGDIPFTTLQVGSPYEFSLITVPIRGMNEEELQRLSKEGQLYLSLAEMQTIRSAFEKLDRDPTDIELETLAQTWSEHCSHKTLAGRIHHVRKDAGGNILREFHFENMLKETIFAATNTLCKANPDIARRCVSVFADNAGVVTFDDQFHVCFKVETHNHPSALEPYGGANTGLGGVIRDTMGTALGAKPVASTDVFCFAPPEISPAELPVGVLHPRRVIKGVVSGVRDYGNRMGIPTVNGAVYFDRRYLGNPLVFCGNVGILPKDKAFKEPKPGDLIVALGGRTGRDGIHGATFSSAELTGESETLSGGAVQIGNAITEKMVLDVLLQARDRNLYNAVTDCGAGGFSSAVGEMGEKIGAEVELANAPLKYEGLSYTEIWISEAQERMVLAMPPENWEEFRRLCESENVEAVVLGTFKPTGRLVLNFHGKQVADLDMQLLHNGRPPVVREAVYRQQTAEAVPGNSVAVCRLPSAVFSHLDTLLAILSSLNVASKHWIIRQYDHEVQGGSVIKPLVGAQNDGPGDAAVVRPRLDSRRGLVISCGMNPMYGDLDPYRMAASGIDEAVRNAVCVGADPKTIALLDNFCWGNTERPETLGSLVEAALACYDVALDFEMPFISGKDSLNNEFRPTGEEPIAIPPTLLISAMGQIDDVSKCVTMDLKKPGNILYQLGETKNEFGGSHYNLLETADGRRQTAADSVPSLDVVAAKKLYETLHSAIMQGLVRSVHDLSEGGLAVAVAEMCIAGGLGADLTGNFDVVTLFSESNSRFIIEVKPEQTAALETLFAGLPLRKLGYVTSEKVLSFGDAFSADVDELKAAWQKPLDW
ncbi:MAG: phosphoribosylformylglycinamidine synthase subunit PurL, partial [Planctomycetaceae bacterium]|nr:phosphoribosylformylglycinamidine synthase subunit PurL [Planctomycetaceae bacterium]